MDLSIITINLNNASGLKKTMDSVLAQTCDAFEWIIIDGGSTDGSIALIKKNQEKIDCWISESDRGIYNAMNKGILNATGKYLLFLNSGDFLAGNNIVELFKKQNDGSSFIVGHAVWEGESAALKRDEMTSIKDIVFRLCVSAFPHQSTFIRRDVFDKYGLYREDKKMASDWYLTVNALIKGGETLSSLPSVIAICEKGGICWQHRDALYQEREDLIHENPYFATLFDFYTRNQDFIFALKSNRFVFFLFRIYYFFFRKRKTHSLRSS